jgi:phage N-6-adenine-methyltransferase
MSRTRQDYQTPRELLRAVESRFGLITLDVAAHDQNHVCGGEWLGPGSPIAENAFEVPSWSELALGGLIWCNPPYERIRPWVRRAGIEITQDPRCRIAVLVPAGIGATWFTRFVQQKALVLNLQPRITFVGEKDPFDRDCILAVYGEPPGFESWRWDRQPKVAPVMNATGESQPGSQTEGKMAHTGKRLSDAIVQERCAFVQELIRSGMARADILKAFRERFGDVSTRAIDGYLRRAREAFMVEAVAAPSLSESRSQERASFLSDLAHDVQQAKAEGVWSAVASLRKLEAEVRGLRVLRPLVDPPPSVTNNNLIVLTPDEREHRLRLLRRIMDRQSAPALEAEGTEAEPAASAE